MMDGSGRRLTEEEARRIWKRAAELQARAGDAASRGSLPVPAEPVEGLAPSEVTAAAVEAGIGSEYVQVAIAELDVGAIGGSGDARVQKLGRRLIGHPFDAIEASRTIQASPAEVHTTLLRIFTALPFGLVLTDTKGRTPFVDDVLVFDAEASSFSQTRFQSRLNMGDAKRLFVTLRPVPGKEDECRVHIRAPLELRRLNLFLGSLFTGGPATVATMVGAGLTVGVAVPVATGLLGAVAGASFFRAIYRWSVRQAQRALDQVLGALAADVQLRRKGIESGPPAIAAGDGHES